MRIHQVHHLYQNRLARATKPFNARGAKVKRCSFCMVAEQHCLCAHQPDIETGVAAILLMSDNEILKPSNTGRLIADVVKESYAFEWSRTEPASELLELLDDDRYQPVVVFPEQYVEERSRLVSDLQQSQLNFDPSRTLLLILLDGSWKEARKMFRKSDYLQHLPVYSIAPDTLSAYAMRSSENQSHLATAEVASMVLSDAGEHQAGELLAEWFGVFGESYMLSKTRNKPDLTKPVLTDYVNRMSEVSMD